MYYQNVPIYIPVICRPSDPTLLKIEQPPTKTTYNYGETIDLTGCVVRAYIDNDTPWDSPNYPNGYIPVGELTATPCTATGSTIAIGWQSLSVNQAITVIPLPTFIDITTQPTKLSYTDGESIDFTGGVVTAYIDENTIWGVVPNNELIIVPSTATAGQIIYPAYETAGLVTITSIQNVVSLVQDILNTAESYVTYPTQDGIDWQSELRAYNGKMACVRHATGYGNNRTVAINIKVYDYSVGDTVDLAQSPTPIFKIQYTASAYMPASIIYWGINNSSTDVQFSGDDFFVGENILTGQNWRYVSNVNISGSQQTETVSWNRPVDHQTLTDTFDISVS